MEALVNQCVQKVENEILAAADFNLNIGTGSEVLSGLLKFANKEYDFSRILDPANTSALQRIFFQEVGQKFELL